MKLFIMSVIHLVEKQIIFTIKLLLHKKTVLYYSRNLFGIVIQVETPLTLLKKFILVSRKFNCPLFYYFYIKTELTINLITRK